MREITPIIFLIRYGVSDFVVTNYQVTIHLLIQVTSFSRS